MKNIYKLITASFLVVMVVFAGCQKMEITKIVGFIQGHAFDGTTNAPLDSVKIVWSVAGVKDSTVASADDGYIINDLPSGEYSIWCSKANYTTVVVDRDIPLDYSATAVRGGDNRAYVVTYNPNLYPLNAGIAGRLYKNENGIQTPIAGASVQLDYNTLSSEDDEYYRFIPNLYEVTTDADGFYSFANIPATNVYVRFLEYTDGNGETYYDPSSTGTSSRNIYLKASSTYAFPNVVLSRLTDGIRLTGSNTFASTGTGTTEFDPASDITLTFNKDVDEASTLDRGYVRLRVGGIDVAATVTFAANVITINPDEDLSPNTSYNISYNAYAAQTYDNTSSSINFSTVNNATIPAQVANFGVAYDYMGTGWLADYNTTGIWFSFDRIANAESYEVYARDDYHNTEFVKVGNFNQSDYLQGLFHSWVSLPSQFNYYIDDGVQTPFSHGTIVSYKVRAVNTAGSGSFSSIVTVKDEISFDSGDLGISNSQSSSADNSTGGTTLTITMTFTVNSGRYADVSVIPNVRLWNGATEITPLTSTVVWDNHQNGTITFDVPANTDYSGMELRLHNVTDSSGNTMDPNDYEIETLY